MELVGLVGEKQSGKSTVARMLVDEGWLEYAFATPLKDICGILGAPSSSLHGSADDKERIIPHLGVSGRQLMQSVGTELFRVTLPRVLPSLLPRHLWVHLMRQQLEKHQATDARIVVSDVRFDDEAQLILDMGGTLIRIVRPPAGGHRNEDPHQSESGLHHVQVHEVVENTGTVVQLQQRVYKWLRVKED
jgi:hypothetical protein